MRKEGNQKDFLVQVKHYLLYQYQSKLVQVAQHKFDIHTQEERHSSQSNYQCFYTAAAVPTVEKWLLLQEKLRTSTLSDTDKLSE